jgi:hypothetical protein
MNAGDAISANKLYKKAVGFRQTRDKIEHNIKGFTLFGR